MISLLRVVAREVGVLTSETLRERFHRVLPGDNSAAWAAELGFVERAADPQKQAAFDAAAAAETEKTKEAVEPAEVKVTLLGLEVETEASGSGLKGFLTDQVKTSAVDAGSQALAGEETEQVPAGGAPAPADRSGDGRPDPDPQQ